ncbi:MAG: hypothetical protein M1838_006041 [Thelocarpon superellum]|nr:MAG: hypothetical protein M1838_006041 [Thelocarpon superellum]
MGLPVFREPVVVVESKTMVDPSAVARSSIRRSRAVRYPRVRSNASTNRLSSTRDSPGPPPRTLHVPDGVRREVFRSQPLESETQAEVEADHAHREASDRRRMENGRALLRDALSYERPGRLLRENLRFASRDFPTSMIHPDMLRASGADAPFYDAWERFEEENARIEAMRGRYAPTPPPYSPGEGAVRPPSQSINTRSESGNGNGNGRVGFASYSPRFAPAHRFDETSVDPPRQQPSPEETSGGNIDLSELPPLRRMGRRSIPNVRPALSGRDRPQMQDGAMDGLGDRERSMSPTDDPWDNIISTIAPDQHLPSASSSFTSATASASATSLASQSLGNSASTSTSLTVPSDSEHPQVCDDPIHLETDSEEDSEIDDDDDQRAGPYANFDVFETVGPDPAHPDQRIRTRHLRLRGFNDDHDNNDDVHARDEHEHGPDYAPDGDEPPQLDLRDDQHNLQDMQRILNRMARRQDIPDDWWAGAGLSRNLSARVDRLERERL